MLKQLRVGPALNWLRGEVSTFGTCELKYEPILLWTACESVQIQNNSPSVRGSSITSTEVPAGLAEAAKIRMRCGASWNGTTTAG